MEAVKEKRLERYPAYKDSGVEWLGKIPENWELERLGSRFEERRTKVSDKDFPPLSVTKNGILPQLENAAKSNDGDNRKLVKQGDFVINSRSDRKGSSGISDKNGSVSLINIVLKPRKVYGPYCNYLLKSTAFIEENYRIGHGIVADLWTTRYDEMKNIKLAFPSIVEQTAIANFLDEKCSKIDAAIAQKQKLIELLKECKQILIQNAVTKGLDPDVKMKDSGVEWIGEIPEYWEVRKVKHVTTKIGSGVTPSGGGTTYIEEGIPLLRSQNVHFGHIDLENAAKISQAVHDSMSNSKVKRGDILLNITGGSIGRCHFIETDSPINVNQHVCIIRPDCLIRTKFLNAVLASEIGQGQIWFFQQGGGREGLNFQALKNFSIPYPPLEEQGKIVEKLARDVLKFDKGVHLQQQQIQKLKEYKSSLIDAAVTGKIKVS